MKLAVSFLIAMCSTWTFAQTFTSSHLPIVVINTGSGTFDDANIPDDPKITASMGIINNATGTNNMTDPFTYSSSIGIETRGNSTQGFSKKTYGRSTPVELGYWQVERE